MLMFALLFKGVADKLTCTSVFKNYSFFPLVKFFTMLFTFLCNLWKRSVLVICILTDANVLMLPISGLQKFKDYVFIIKVSAKRHKKSQTWCDGFVNTTSLLLMVSFFRSLK